MQGNSIIILKYEIQPNTLQSSHIKMPGVGEQFSNVQNICVVMKVYPFLPLSVYNFALFTIFNNVFIYINLEVLRSENVTNCKRDTRLEKIFIVSYGCPPS